MKEVTNIKSFKKQTCWSSFNVRIWTNIWRGHFGRIRGKKNKKREKGRIKKMERWRTGREGWVDAVVCSLKTFPVSHFRCFNDTVRWDDPVKNQNHRRVTGSECSSVSSNTDSVQTSQLLPHQTGNQFTVELSCETGRRRRQTVDTKLKRPRLHGDSSAACFHIHTDTSGNFQVWTNTKFEIWQQETEQMLVFSFSWFCVEVTLGSPASTLSLCPECVLSGRRETGSDISLRWSGRRWQETLLACSARLQCARAETHTDDSWAHTPAQEVKGWCHHVTDWLTHHSLSSSPSTTITSPSENVSSSRLSAEQS